MNYSNYSFTLNLQIHQSQISIPVSLNDTARKLYITFIDGRKPYTIPDGCRAVFVGFKSDETTLFNDCIIQENKTVIYEFTEQTANVEGVVNCEIRLYGEDGKQLTSSQFVMIVDENDTRDISLSENESTAIDNIIHAEIGRVEAESEREAAEKSRKELAGFLATSGGVIVSDEEPKEGLANVWVDDSPEKEEIRLLDSTDIAQELTDDDEKIPSVALLKKSLDELETGASGKDGLTPYIGDNGNWWIGETDTGVKAEGIDGKDGVTIASIIENDDETAICFSDGTVVGIKNGKDGTNGIGISSIVKTKTNGRVDTYTITYTNNTTATFTVTNGANGTSVTIASIGDVIDETTEEVIGHTVNFSDGKSLTVYNGVNGKDGRGISSVLKTSTNGLVDTYTITFTDNTTATFTVTNGKAGTSVTVTNVSESTIDGGSNVVTFSGGKTLTVKNGKNGAEGKTPYIKNKTWWIGDIDTGVKAEGTNGTSVTVTNVTESTASGGSNIVTFSDGKTVTVKNGKDGKTYVLTETDKNEIAEQAVKLIDGVPSYWQTHLNERVEDIRRAMESAGRNKSSFFFYSDAHWSNDTTYTAKLAPTLLKYLYKNTPINKTNYGGDIVSAESTDTDIMAYLWDWRKQLRGLPNHHSVIGNHDDGNSTDRLLSKEYIYSYLFAPEESNDIVWGGDFYYYIDDKTEKTRYLYLDIFYDRVSEAQTTFVSEALKSTPTDWHIVAICHAWFGVNYGTAEDPIYPPVLNGLATEMQPFFDMFDNYNARSGEFGTCGGWVELCIGGHYHLDHYDHTDGGIPVIIVEADTLHNRSGTMPQKNTTDEATVSAVVVDYNNKVVKVIRVGRGGSYEVPINVNKASYTNVIPLSIDKDGNIFNGGKGWADKSRIGSGGIYLGNGEHYVTGHIEIDPTIVNTFFLKNVTFDSTTHNDFKFGMFYFDTNFAKLSLVSYTTDIASNTTLYAPKLEGTNIVKFRVPPNIFTDAGVTPKYVAICCSYIGDDSIITINEPIE